MFEYFVSEVGQFLKAEQRARGYYPDLSQVEREFGKSLARQSRAAGLVGALRRRGLSYSPRGAREYSQPVTGTPLLDLTAPYQLPWGTVQTYLMWKLPRLYAGDSFEIGGLSIRRAVDYGFTVTNPTHIYRVVSDGHGRSLAIARVMNLLRGDRSHCQARALPLPRFAPAPEAAPPPVAIAPVMPDLPPVAGIGLPALVKVKLPPIIRRRRNRADD